MKKEVVLVFAIAFMTGRTTGQIPLTAAPTASTTPVINVQDRSLGAVGDGVHDDTAAVSMAFARLQAHGGGVYFPPGSYRITRTLQLSARGFRLYGLRGKSILTTDNLTRLLLLKDCSDGTFTDLSFRATTKDSRRAKGGHTLILANNNAISDLDFQGCTFSASDSDMNGVYFVTHSDTPDLFRGIHFTDCNFAHIGRNAAEIQNLAQSQATTRSISGIVFKDCTFLDCGAQQWGMGISASAGRYDSGLTVTGCTFDRVHFCAIEAMFNQVLIDKNRFVNAGSGKTDIIHVTPKRFGLKGFTISNNDASDSSYRGCLIWNCSEVQMTGNTFLGTGRIFSLRKDSEMSFANDHFASASGIAIVEDQPCVRVRFSGCTISNSSGGIFVCRTNENPGISFANCTLSATGKKAFKIPSGTSLHLAGSTLNGQNLGDSD